MPRRCMPRAGALSGLALLLITAGVPARAQQGATPAAAAATQPAASKAPAPPEVNGPYMRLVKRREWTIRAQIMLQLESNFVLGIDGNDGSRFRFDGMSMIFPVLRSSASSFWRPNTFKGTLYVANREVDTTATLIGPYHAGAVYARYDAGPGVSQVVRLIHTHQVTSWDTVFNELEALKVPWPTGDWPDEARSTFGAQAFVNPRQDPEPAIAQLVHHWTDGKDPKSISPVLLAKWFAGKVQEHVQLIGDGVNRAYEIGGGGAVEGVELQGAERTALLGKGSTHDMVCLLAAVYRAAGLPARTVIGVDEDPERKSREVRSWVEFCLYDEAKDTITWVPVDIARLRARSSRMLPLDRPWEYFGTHDELHRVAPFAFHFIPPVDVRSYNSPAFYGWRQIPVNAPYANQTIDLDVSRTVQTGAPDRG
ncbi:MAG: transglutaminase-like domain-containing protein, partial [Phycisphaerales bacterium JB059]